MAWGEAVSEDYAVSFGVRKTADWRERKPSDKAVRTARRQGIDPAGKRAGELSDSIEIRLGARIFDRHVRG